MNMLFEYDRILRIIMAVVMTMTDTTRTTDYLIVTIPMTSLAMTRGRVSEPLHEDCNNRTYFHLHIITRKIQIFP